MNAPPENPLSPPLCAFLYVNLRCNSRCSYCWIWKQSAKNLPLAKLAGVIEQLAELGVRRTYLGAGEPLLHPELPEIVRAVSSRGMSPAIITNGVSFDRDRMLRVMDAGLETAILSLDTTDPDTYRMLRGVPVTSVLRCLDFMLAQKPRYPRLELRVTCVVSRANAPQIPQLVRYCSERGVLVGLQPLHKIFHGEERTAAELAFSKEDLPSLNALIRELQDMKRGGFLIDNPESYLAHFPRFLAHGGLPAGFECLAGYYTIFINERLDVRGCWYAPPVGNLNRDRLTELWRSARYAQMREDMKRLRCPTCWSGCSGEIPVKAAEWLPAGTGRRPDQ